MQEFKYQIVIAGVISGPNKQQVAEMLAANLHIPLALIETVKQINVNAEPVSKVEVVKGSSFNPHGIKLEK